MTLPSAREVRAAKLQQAGAEADRSISVTRTHDGEVTVFQATETTSLDPGDSRTQGVTEVGGKRRELLLDIDPVGIPAEKCADGKAMSEIVHARPAMVAWAPQADLAGQAPENTI